MTSIATREPKVESNPQTPDCSVFQDRDLPDAAVEKRPRRHRRGRFSLWRAKLGSWPRRRSVLLRRSLLAGGRLVLGNDIGGNAAAVLNVDPVLARPVPDFGRVLRRAGPPTSATCDTTAAPGGAADLAGVGVVLAESGPELLGVLLVQVDLVFSPVQGEPHGTLGRPAVNVVYEECCDLLGHLESAFPWYRQPSWRRLWSVRRRPGTHPVPHKPGEY